MVPVKGAVQVPRIVKLPLCERVIERVIERGDRRERRASVGQARNTRPVRNSRRHDLEAPDATSSTSELASGRT